MTQAGAATGPREDATTDEVRFEVVDHVARVTIDRPAVLNAVDGVTHQRLRDIWATIEADPEVRVVVVTGAGDRAFCVGADMSSTAIEQTGLEYWANVDPDGFGGLSLRTSLDVPIIARVNGYAMGGGMEMVLGCDIVVASETAKFALSEPRVGRLPLDGGITQLVRRVPYTQAMGLLLTGRRASAAEMHHMGLVNEVVPVDELDTAVERWVQDILACSPSSLRAIKQVVQRTRHMTAQDARTQRVPALIAALDSADSKEGVLAFQQKRSPVWTGR
jgi:crotonobetainyl-CoA hydratase